MPNLIYLGNFSSVDTQECNWTAESEGSLVGVSRTYSRMSIVSAQVSDGGDGVVNDDDYGTYDYIKYNIALTGRPVAQRPIRRFWPM